MRTLSPFLAFCLSLSCATLSPAQDTSSKPATAAPTTTPSQADLEAEFTKMLTDATLTGRWSGVKEGELTEERDESYSITGVTKVEGDKWTVNARVKYKGADFPIAIPARVNWAGDTAILSVSDLTMPGGNSYWARVLFYKNTYAGSWGVAGGGVGGLLNGLVTQKAP